MNTQRLDPVRLTDRRDSSISLGRCPRLNLDWMLQVHEQRLSLASRKDFSNGHTVLKRRGLQAENALMDSLRQNHGFPTGLARTLVQHANSCPLRVWLVDNSGSMHHNDGHIVVMNKNNKIENVNCTRWEEVCATILWHAQLAASLETPTAVRFINDPYVGPQQLGVAASQRLDGPEEVKRLKELLYKTRPGGTSAPMSAHLAEIVGDICDMADKLTQEQRWLTLTLVTDGLPTDDEGNQGPQVNQAFVETLQLLQSFPVWVVIRLSTDEQQVVDFYQNLDSHAGQDLHLDVIDDYISEAECVQQHNPWLNYGYALHLCRESGVHADVLDGLNDRPLEPSELCEFVGLLFDRSHNPSEAPLVPNLHVDQPLPDPATHYLPFRVQLEELLNKNGKVWNPLKKKFVPWIDLKEMDRIYGQGHTSSCTDSCTLL